MDNMEKMMQQILERMDADREERKADHENMAAKQEEMLARIKDNRKADR
jgi:hypothetical protein